MGIVVVYKKQRPFFMTDGIVSISVPDAGATEAAQPALTEQYIDDGSSEEAKKIRAELSGALTALAGLPVPKDLLDRLESALSNPITPDKFQQLKMLAQEANGVAGSATGGAMLSGGLSLLSADGESPGDGFKEGINSELTNIGKVLEVKRGVQSWLSKAWESMASADETQFFASLQHGVNQYDKEEGLGGPNLSA